jgi:ubiquinone/menaquinone biosynthesis C-methylase UbiE
MIRSSTFDGECELSELLLDLYRKQREVRPEDGYLVTHSNPRVVDTQVSVFGFYSAYLPAQGRVLDWGCRHAPDACLMRKRFGDGLRIDGCDIAEVGAFDVFHNYAELHYEVLRGAVQLPYEDNSFDAVLGSGTLEHVPMDYESLKELHRVLKVHGRLIITYLPNRLSWEEWYQRRVAKEWFHRRLYGLGEIVRLVQRAGYALRVAGYQTRADMLPAKSLRHRMLRAAGCLFPMHWFCSTLCLVAEKVHVM